MNKLALAMRAGSAVTRQIKRQFSDGEGGRCAMGAVAYAVGADELSLAEFVNLFPLLDEHFTFENEHASFLLMVHILYLNDIAGWSREKIADWIETLYSDLPERKSEKPLKEINVSLSACS